ncbi:DUF5690 family protein [Microbulbifer variabilis]|uniref:DUF5690 family protein n=1 Tax=Microbulbifer variabilis TaxID=266805 RepID=A0ABY4VBX1_9GAMM|nr:DUF5690 family protein [Microbulbifer variabilis]USD20678.1 DUF5690 family protein [Microbulbifer variabilis]
MNIPCEYINEKFLPSGMVIELKKRLSQKRNHKHLKSGLDQMAAIDKMEKTGKKQESDSSEDFNSELFLLLFSGVAAFFTYFCMYAFRKPFAAASYANISGWEFTLDFKTALIISQVLGYAFSKIIGIKVVSELRPLQRGRMLVILILFSHLALIAFALIPAPYNVVMLFFNGLPLGMVWGLVFSYLEGRRLTEALGTILCVSLIVSSGAVKAVAAYLMLEWKVPEIWMPATVGLLFLPALILSTFTLSRIPQPNQADIRARKQRVPMTNEMRWTFVNETNLGLLALIIAYVFLTAFRDFSDNFAAELWQALGHGQAPQIFLTSTLPVALIVLASLALLIFVRNNYRALQLNQLLVAAGGAICITSTLAFELDIVSGAAWMIGINIGLYIGYVPFNCLLFERLVACTKSLGNAGFVIYLADSAGYIGSISVMLYKTFAQPNLNWLQFTQQLSYATGFACILLMLLSLLFFRRLHRNSSSRLRLITSPV